MPEELMWKGCNFTSWWLTSAGSRHFGFTESIPAGRERQLCGNRDARTLAGLETADPTTRPLPSSVTWLKPPQR